MIKWGLVLGNTHLALYFLALERQPILHLTIPYLQQALEYHPILILILILIHILSTVQ